MDWGTFEMKRLMAGTAAIVGLAGTVALSPIGGAIAGHTNIVRLGRRLQIGTPITIS